MIVYIMYDFHVSKPGTVIYNDMDVTTIKYFWRN